MEQQNQPIENQPNNEGNHAEENVDEEEEEEENNGDANVMAPVQQQQLIPFFSNAVEKRAFNSLLWHPLRFATTLVKLGYDPYPLSVGKMRVLYGPTTYFHPNMFIYVKNLCHSHGINTIYNGSVAHLAASVAGDLCGIYVGNFMDAHLPELGGRLEQMDQVRNMRELTTHQMLRFYVRQAIRESVSQCFATFAARPFIVVMLRQIAQLISSEAKYLPVGILQPLRLIWAEEGLAGLFSGLVPYLVGQILVIWGSAAARFLVAECVRELERDYDLNDRQTLWWFDMTRWYCLGVCKWLINSWYQSFDVVSTMMAVNESGLVIPTMPLAPSLLAHWSDAYAGLSPFDGQRGYKNFFRYEPGPVTVGTDGKLYAANNRLHHHFIHQ